MEEMENRERKIISQCGQHKAVNSKFTHFSFRKQPDSQVEDPVVYLHTTSLRKNFFMLRGELSQNAGFFLTDTHAEIQLHKKLLCHSAKRVVPCYIYICRLLVVGSMFSCPTITKVALMAELNNAFTVYTLTSFCISPVLLREVRGQI